MSAGNPVAIAEQLLELVKSISEPQVDPLKVYNTKIEIQNACDSLLIKLLGPLEYTVLVAGASTCNYCLFLLPIITCLFQIESCHESASLHFVTSLDIADLIGDGQSTLLELSKKADVDPQFLGNAKIQFHVTSQH
jgi:hypothetical protein